MERYTEEQRRGESPSRCYHSTRKRLIKSFRNEKKKKSIDQAGRTSASHNASGKSNETGWTLVFRGGQCGQANRPRC